MASLGWVTLGAATEDVTPLFFPEKPGDLFCLSLSLSLSLFIAFTRVSPLLESVTPHLFYLSDLVSPLFFVNLPTFFFLLVSHPEGCHPGRSAPPASLVTPLWNSFPSVPCDNSLSLYVCPGDSCSTLSGVARIFADRCIHRRRCTLIFRLAY